LAPTFFFPQADHIRILRAADMPNFSLSTLAILLGLLVAALNLPGVLKPASFAAAAQKFPRNTPVGYPLMLLATGWFLYYLSIEAVSDFTSFKPLLYALFAGVGIGTCIFVRDFLPVRGLAAVLLVLAKLMVDTGREHIGESPWVDLWQAWAYVLAIAGMWFTISPWRLRDMINWATANVSRTRALSTVRLAFGLLFVVLGLTVYR
jgi:hypothetical protein